MSSHLWINDSIFMPENRKRTVIRDIIRYAYYPKYHKEIMMKGQIPMPAIPVRSCGRFSRKSGQVRAGINLK